MNLLIVESRQICSRLLNCGVDQPTSRDQFIEILKLLVESGAVGLSFCEIISGSERYVGMPSLGHSLLPWAKLRSYVIMFQLQNDRRNISRASQCASPYDILLNAGASFGFPILLRRDYFQYPPVLTGLAGYHDQYIDDIHESLLHMLSRDVATLDSFHKISLSLLLTEICCGRSPELWETWRQAHGLPADTAFSPGPLVDEIASIIALQGSLDEVAIIYHVLNTLFRTGDIDAGKEILSLFVTRSPSFSASLIRAFSWEQVRMLPPVHFLNKNSGMQELLEEYGADHNCIMYYSMASVPDIAYWEEALGEDVDEKVLNMLLLFSARSCPTENAEYLLSRGASIHFLGRVKNYFSEITALACAAVSGEMEMVMLLLKNGADVLQEFEHFPGQKVTVAKLLGPCNRPDLKRMLAQLECEERVRRGTTQGLSF